MPDPWQAVADEVLLILSGYATPLLADEVVLLVDDENEARLS